jgi:hypothetical protein
METRRFRYREQNNMRIGLSLKLTPTKIVNPNFLILPVFGSNRNAQRNIASLVKFLRFL